MITKEQHLEFERLAKPLMQWLNDNHHPHVTVLLDSEGAELVEGLATVKRMSPLVPPPPDAVDAFLAEVRAELLRARTKFPGDRIMTIALMEEVGELAKALLDEPAANVRKEAVQSAVMCARVVLDGDGSVIQWRKEKGLDPLIAAPTPVPPTV